MGKREEKRNLKLCMLAKIKEKKQILFGAFNNKLTKQDKIKIWSDLSSYAKSIGVIPLNKDWTYLRDVWWPNVRKSSTEKLDNARATGTGGGEDKLLTEVDDMVIDIIGKESPVATGLDVPESMELPLGPLDMSPTSPESTLSLEQEEPCHNSDVPFEEPDEVICNEESVAATSKSPTHNVKLSTIVRCATKKIDMEKSKLQVELLKLQIYKSKLECRKLEMEMGIARSCYTSNIRENTDVVYVQQPTTVQSPILIIENEDVSVENEDTLKK